MLSANALRNIVPGSGPRSWTQADFSFFAPNAASPTRARRISSFFIGHRVEARWRYPARVLFFIERTARCASLAGRTSST